jgi:hypothetical protein
LRLLLVVTIRRRVNRGRLLLPRRQLAHGPAHRASRGLLHLDLLELARLLGTLGLQLLLLTRRHVLVWHVFSPFAATWDRRE